MKHFIVFCFFFLLCLNIAEAQTNVNIAGPENVLVVYNANSDTSEMVMEYYVNARNIPSSNIVPLELDRADITIGGVTHPIIIAQETDIIRDSINHEIGTWYATEHAWKYYYEYIAAPIKNHISSNNLTDIRYIVLVKGVPFKVQAAADGSSAICNVTVDGLLCLLNTVNYEDFLHDLYTVMRSYAQPQPNYNYVGSRQILNPYFTGVYGIDPNYSFNYRFAPGYFTRYWNGHTVKLDYLVSHLDGISYDVVKGIIDRSVEPDKSGEAYWVLDHDPGLNSFHYLFSDTKSRLESFGFNVEHDATDNWITSHSENVMGYTSWGTHAENGNCTWNDSTWVKDSLNFNLSNGAVFNTLESYNATSLTTLKWRHIPNVPPDCNHTQGLATQFTEIGGTGIMGHAWEPNVSGAVECRKFFPSYAMGYSLVDAIYQGMQFLAWVNVVVGDPLTTIAWGKQLLTDDLIWDGTNLVTGEVYVPYGNSLTINDDAIINLRHNGFITGGGEIIIGENVTFNVNSWQRALFLSYDNFKNPRLVWGAHPESDNNVEYHLYRKLTDDGDWELLTQTTDLEYIDSEIELMGPLPTRPNSFYMVFAYLLESETPETPDTSNIVSTWTDKGQQKIAIKGSLNKDFSYTLSQNYPNPSNPETMISYTIANNSFVTLKVFDLLGREIAELVNIEHEAGKYSVAFDASKLSSGIYFYTLQAGQFIETRKMTVMK